jgi:hypothetical protein
VKALDEACAALPEDGLGERKKTEDAPPPPPDSGEAAVERLSLEQLRKVETSGSPSFATPAPVATASDSKRKLVIAAVAGAVLLVALVVGLALGGGGSDADPEEPERKAEPIVLAENPPVDQPETAVATPTGTVQPVEKSAPPSAGGSTPPAAAPKTTAASPPDSSATSGAAAQPAASESALLVGATTTIVWRGQLDPGGELRIEGDKASVGEISRGLPGGPVQIEVSPNVLEILEAPSEANGWNRLRLRNGGDRQEPRRYFIIRCRAL